MDMLKQTPSQTVGPFFHFALKRRPVLVEDQTKGQPIYLKGQVLDGDGQPVPDALVEIWQADSQGIFDHPDDPRRAQADPHFRGFGRSGTTQGGLYTFKTIKPGRVAWNDQQDQAPHINVRVFARGMLIHAVTRLYFADEPSNATDPVLTSIEDPARRQTLIAAFEPPNDLPTYRLDIILQGDRETVFFNP